MTFTKTIETAREALQLSQLWLANCMPITEIIGKKPLPVIAKSLAALPDKPMTEQEIIKIIRNSRPYEGAKRFTHRESIAIMNALKAANVLYVKEGK